MAKNLEEQFVHFSKFGDVKSTGKFITLVQIDRWLKQAKVIDDQKVTTMDTGFVFNKFRTKSLSHTEFLKFIEELASHKRLSSADLINKLVDCSRPGPNKTAIHHIRFSPKVIARTT